MGEERKMQGFGTLVFLDVSPGSEFGLDLKTWTTLDKFRGVKLVPCGLRFVRLGESGMFVHLQKPGEVLAFRWIEDALKRVEEYELQGLQQAVRSMELDKFLGPYELNELSTWQGLSQYVSLQVLEKAKIPLERMIVAGQVLDNEQDKYCSATLTALPQVSSLVRSCRRGEPQGQEGVERYLTKSDGSALSSTELFALEQDPSPLLEKLVEIEYGGDILFFFGELQLSFLLLLYLARQDSLQFWKSAIHLFCTASSTHSRHPDWVKRFCDVITAQLVLLPPDLFQDELMEDNFLNEALGQLLQVEGDEVLSLRKAVRKQFGKTALQRLENFENELEESFLVASIDQSCAHKTTHSFNDASESEGEDEVADSNLPVQRMSWMIG